MKERKKRSVIWITSTNDFTNIVKQSKSIADICRYFNFGVKGSTYTAIKSRLAKDNIDISHFQKRNPSKYFYVDKETFLSRLKPNTPSIDREFIKKKLLEFNLVRNECAECKLLPIWNNKPLTLHLDHIDGDKSNNSLENLRLLCPNCHSQTETFGIGIRKIKKYFCSECNAETAGYKNRCVRCGHKSKRKTNRPSKETLEILISTTPMTTIGKQFNVSDNAVRKWCRYYQIPIPKNGKGFWTINKMVG